MRVASLIAVDDAGELRSREPDHAFGRACHYCSPMLFLAAFHRLWTPQEPAPNDLLAEARAAIGHVGLLIIALVFVLLSYWRG